MINMDLSIFNNSPFSLSPDQKSEEDIIEEIRLRVVELLDANPELLFSYLYRLDVEEPKIKMALKHPEFTADNALAHLIWERQKQRLETRKEYGSPNADF